jgi:transcriptional regulator with XRE-family HTH domain
MSKAVGEAVRAYRQARGFTQEELAHAAATCVGTVSLIERGQTNANRHTLTRIARALRVKVAQLERGVFYGDAQGRSAS